MKLTAGSTYTGVIEQYHEVNGFILAQKPARIRVIGQAPVARTDIFDMVSDGETFHIFVPSKSQFITGPANLERPGKKPIENLRPQHLVDAIFWSPIPKEDPSLIEEADDGGQRFYVLTVVRATHDGTAGTSMAGSEEWEIARKIWFSRLDLNISRIQMYGPGGTVNSDIRYSGWTDFGGARYARQITLFRPESDYQLEIGIRKLTANEPIPAARFVLKQPAGTALVQVGEETKEQQR